MFSFPILALQTQVEEALPSHQQVGGGDSEK
jgi:hypothetical protein